MLFNLLGGKLGVFLRLASVFSAFSVVGIHGWEGAFYLTTEGAEGSRSLVGGA